MSSLNWKPILRLIAMKTLGVLLAIVFLPTAAAFIAYPLIALATTHGGEDAKIVSTSDHLGKLKSGCRIGGIFTVSVEMAGEKPKPHQKPAVHEKIYSLYPDWPDQLEPGKGDMIRVWPVKKPLVGAPVTDGWGWFIVGTVFVLGLVMLEFTFLALTMA